MTAGQEAAAGRQVKVRDGDAFSYPGQSQDAADVVVDDQRGFGSRHSHVEQVELICWDFT